MRRPLLLALLLATLAAASPTGAANPIPQENLLGASTRWQAYNSWGGKSLYDFNSLNVVPANRVSFDRPFLWDAPGNQPVSKWELPLVHFLEREGYDVSYATDADVDRDPDLLLRHRLAIV